MKKINTAGSQNSEEKQESNSSNFRDIMAHIKNELDAFPPHEQEELLLHILFSRFESRMRR